MKLAILSISLAFALVNGQGSVSEWAPAGPGDFRGPCPMMNTLANHYFLPHDGLNITEYNAIHALTTALNFDAALAAIMWEAAVIANPEPNATYFTLEQLNVHNVLEHDASMSRLDYYFGNNHVFNQEIFNTTTAYWTGDVLDVNMLANGKIARQVTSRATNPTYTFDEDMQQHSLGEVAAPIIVFGDLTTATVNRSLVEYFFENERLPSELGWAAQADAVTLDAILTMTEIIDNATSLLTFTTPVVPRRRNLHSGVRS